MTAHLISLEGIEAAGKSSQIPILQKWLKKELNVDSIAVREPGGTPLADKIREILLNDSIKSFSVSTEVLLFYAARSSLLSTTIIPALKKGVWVISDRYIDSTRAYQLSEEKLINSIENIISPPTPSLTFLLDLPVELAIQRLKTRKEKKSRIDKKSAKFHSNIAQNFIKIANNPKNKDRFCIIDASVSVESISSQIQQAIKDRLLHQND